MTTPTSTTTTTTTTTPTTTLPKTYTKSDVALHGSASNCWTIVNGNVYNLTNWIASHPGGESAIISMCGGDGSAGFNNQHGGQGKPERIIESFLIGALK